MAGKTANWKPGPTVCRCCLAEGCYKDISTEYFWMGKREVYAEMLTNTFNVSIAFSQSGGPNSNSRLICEPCISRLRDASNFKRQVLDCEKTFMQHLDPGSSLSHQDLPEELAGLDDAVKVERVKIERDAPSDDDFDATPDFLDDDDDELDQPLTNFATKEPKKEAVSLLEELLDNPAVTIKKKSVVKTKQPPAKKVKRTETAKPTSSKVVAKTATAEKKKKGPVIAEARRKTVPLFQVKYDTTLCKPLGVVSDITKLKMLKNKPRVEILKTSLPIQKRLEVSRSSMPVQKSTEVSRSSLLIQEILEVSKSSQVEEDIPISRSPSPMDWPMSSLPTRSENSERTKELLGLQQQLVKMKASTKRGTQNILSVFEFSTAFPFKFSFNKFICYICKETYLSLPKLKTHMEQHDFGSIKTWINKNKEFIVRTDISDLLCKICTKPMKDLAQLKIHLKESHQKPIDLEINDDMVPFDLTDPDGQHKCVVCKETFVRVSVLVNHMSTHYSNYSCEICGAGFMVYSNLRSHLKVHENGNHPCDQCGKKFKNTLRRDKHVRMVHLKCFPVKCTMCTATFRTSDGKYKHLQRVHNQKITLHQCQSCDRAYRMKYSLIHHTRNVHLGERKYQCDLCSQRFTENSSLTLHKKIHTGERNFKCDVCGRAFSRKSNLITHLKTHRDKSF